MVKKNLGSYSMNQRIAFGFVVAMVLIASGFTISFYSYNRYGGDMQRIRHTYEVIGALENTLSLMKDVETGSRGFVITQDSAYLEPYLNAMKVLPGQIEHLEMLTKDNRIQIKRRLVLEKLIRDKLSITEGRMDILAFDPRSNAISAESKRRMDVLRKHVALMIETERALMDTRNRQADRSFMSTLVVIFLLFLLTSLTLIVLYRLLDKELEHRKQTADRLLAYDAQLRGQIRQLEASNEELERFAFVASHDLQEPLRKIQSFANLITDRYANLFDSDSMVFMSKISSSAERMSKLIKDLLNFSRISSQQENFKPVYLGEIVQRIIEDQELRISRLNAQVEIGDLPVIEGIASQMDHLFTNLISNALKFVRPDVRPLLRIQVQAIHGERYPALIPDRRYVEISVEDNGIGFDEKYVEHIFNVFQRLHGKNTFEGTGIGLAICKRVVMYHHGYITARSQLNHGTTFIVVLPESQSQQHYDRPTTEANSYPVS